MLAIILWLSPIAVAMSQDEEEEPVYQLNSQWQMQLKLHKIKDYMAYKGSTMHSMLGVDASWRVRDDKTKQWTKVRRYETLWYHDGAAVGCRREFRLPELAGKHGVIRVVESEDLAAETHSMVNAVIRVLLDVEMKEGSVTSVVVPLDLYDQCGSDLGAFYFYQVKMASALDQMILLNLVSEPARLNRYYRLRTKIAE